MGRKTQPHVRPIKSVDKKDDAGKKCRVFSGALMLSVSLHRTSKQAGASQFQSYGIEICLLPNVIEDSYNGLSSALRFFIVNVKVANKCV
jgi:hypothetical protein